MSVKRPSLFVALLCVLSACVQSSGRFGIDVETPVSSVSRTRASVGDTVTVTLRSSLGLDGESGLASETFADTRLGVCFGEGVPEVSRGGFCDGAGVPLQPWVVVSAGGAYVKDFGDVQVARGVTYPLELTFSFTVTEAKVVTIDPWLRVSSSAANYPRGGVPARIVFE